jgi:hypothetical protein
VELKEEELKEELKKEAKTRASKKLALFPVACRQVVGEFSCQT